MAANNLYIHIILLKTQTSIYLKWETPFILCETIGYDLQLVASVSATNQGSQTLRLIDLVELVE